jgi:uncharacterized membrane protein YoaK (UPF0700 family)
MSAGGRPSTEDLEGDDITAPANAMRRLRDAAAITLAVTSGATDAISFLTLGGAFTSVMTGNLVLLGVSIGHPNGGLARQIAVALLGYIAGCAAGACITGSPVHGEPVWPASVTRGFAVEASLFVVYAAGWWSVGGRPTGPVTAGLLGLSALALGIQSSTVKRFGVSGLSTTYLTATMTTLVIRLASGGRLRDVARHVFLLVALLVGAARRHGAARAERLGARPANTAGVVGRGCHRGRRSNKTTRATALPRSTATLVSSTRLRAAISMLHSPADLRLPSLPGGDTVDACGR